MSEGMRHLCRDCGSAGLGAAPPRCRACGSPRMLAHRELFELTIAHLDCDAFYAAVEKRDRPDLRDRPVIVGGGTRGVVTTCCYIARTFGVRSAQPMFKALKACPEAVVIRPDFTKYRAESRRIMEMMRRLTPLVQPLSLDEAWLDLGGTERLNGGAPAQVLVGLQTAIERETGLTVSIGLAPNKLLAKIASDLDKPRGFSVIGASEAPELLAPRPASILPGVGPALFQRLQRLGLGTVGALARADGRDLDRRLGPGASRLKSMALGRDGRPVEPDQARKSISSETTFASDLRSLEELETVLWPLCETVAVQARRAEVEGGVVTLKLKDTGFRTRTRRRTLSAPTQTARILFEESRALMRQSLAEHPGAFRLVGVGLAGLEPAGSGGRALFSDAEHRARGAEHAMDRLRARFGADALIRGRTLAAPKDPS